MPVYPCVRCDQTVDTHSDPFCRNCGEKQPFTCSRCGKQMNQNDIFQLERLKTKKPLLCLACGEAGEVIECAICKKTLVRSQGKQVSSAPGARVYHTDCYNKQLNTIATLKKLTPVFGLVGLLSGWFLGTSWMPNGHIGSIAGGLVLGAALFALATAGQAILAPK